MRVLLTGKSGFTGIYVVNQLIDQGFEVIEPPRFPIDLRSYSLVHDWIKHEKPDYVIHLAAVSFVGHESVNEIYETNLLGTINLLRSLLETRSPVKKVILASSANIYGNTGLEIISEEQTPCPENHYGISKYSMELAALQWSDILPIHTVRPFNYTGVGQAGRFLIPKIVNHFRENKKTIELGNLDVYRDFSDVRDVARWYAQLLITDASFTKVNFCSGKLVSLENIIHIMNEIAGYDIEVTVNPKFVRNNEIKRLCGDNSLLDSIAPAVDNFSIDETLKWMYRERHLNTNTYSLH